MLSGAANDLGGALSTIDAYTGKPPHVTGVNVLLKVHRGADQAFMRSISLPARVRPGQRVRVRVALQRVRGARFTRTYTLRDPDATRAAAASACASSARTPTRATTASRRSSSASDDERDEGGDPGPGDAARARGAGPRRPRATTACPSRIGRARGEAFRDDDFRISGQAEATVRVTRAAERAIRTSKR